LRALSARATRAHAAGRLGSVAEVLVERIGAQPDGTPVAEGTTRDHLRVRFDASGARTGELVAVRLCATDGDRVLGERPK
jgi:tRNA A37 methylthiotransferase MiaB